ARWKLKTAIPARVAQMQVSPAKPDGAPKVIFAALDASIAAELEPQFADAGCAVITNSSALRMKSDVPLVIPEVNPDHVKLLECQAWRRKSGGFVVTNPNCSAIGLVMALAPLDRQFGLETVMAVTMQAVSGAGYPGVASLDILGNVIPYIAKEEEKMEEETRKLLGRLNGSSIQPGAFGMTTTVGRLRPCGVLDWKFTVLSHNTIRGAAGAALLNAELLKAQGYLEEGVDRDQAFNTFVYIHPINSAPEDLPPMIVMKFGGTSVQDAKAIECAAAIVKGRAAQKLVVVVSAMAKVTDQLLTMARAAGNGDRKNALKLCRALQERHYNTAGELLGTALFTQFHSDLGLDFETLDELLRGIAAVGELTPRTTDYVSAFGEVLSSKIVTAAFSALGIDSALVDSRECIVTDTAHTRAAPLFEETNDRLGKTVQPLLDSGKVPVMGGFIGSTKAGITTTIGRGGSDYSAAIVGAGLGAEKIEIWTDVDGMMTTDPSMCSDARRIKVISFDEA